MCRTAVTNYVPTTWWENWQLTSGVVYRTLGPWSRESHGTSLFGWDHGKTHRLVPNVNPIWIKEQALDFIHLFFFDLHNLSYFDHKMWTLWEQNEGLFLKKNLIFCYYKGSSYVKVGNSFLWINIWLFSKKAHEFAFHPWKGQSTSLNYPLAIVSTLHHVDSLPRLCEKQLVTNWTINKQLLCKKNQHLKNFFLND